ncbi:Uncharacterized protein HZ326_7718 [Fusarium oxysporum f. sp. albedinis]|nr:Uncharacterized protein HZ326_7718 [Fusarium oxysporum f. sp. albedinis]
MGERVSASGSKMIGFLEESNSGVLLAENLQRQPQPSSTHSHSQSQSHSARLSLAQVAFIAKSSGSSKRFLGSDTKYRHINSIFQTQH